MRYDHCSICKKFADLTRHKCPPCWRVWIHDEMDENEAWMIHADNARSAAERFALDWDVGEYALLSGEEIDVVVVSLLDDSNRQRFVVHGETEPVYIAQAKR